MKPCSSPVSLLILLLQLKTKAMATSSSGVGNSENKRNERQKQVMVGELPADFLRVTPISEQQQLAVDEQAAIALQQQLSGNSTVPSNVTGRLSISVIEAKLTKNYGMTRMDPYVRLRIGHTVYETHTDHNGAKNPRWNKGFHCFLFPSVTSIYIEIFDECAFTLDEKIAWAHYTLPESVFRGEILDEWVTLNGRQGDGKEGFINIVLSHTAIPSGTLVYPPQPLVAVMPAPYYVAPGMPYIPQGYTPQYLAMPNAANQIPVNATGQPLIQPGQQQQQQPVQITDADIEQVREMFPNLEADIIRAVMETNNGDKDKTVNALLMLSEGS